MDTEILENNRNKYLLYNHYRYNSYLFSVEKNHQILIQSIPLLFHCNINRLPGYIGKTMPCGIKAYTPTSEDISAISYLNNSFDPVVINEIDALCIESIYLQDCFNTGELIMWVIHDDNLHYKLINLLGIKAEYISKWLNKNGLSITVRVTSHHNIANNYYDSIGTDHHIDKSFFLQKFYVESILVAGKMPLWWLLGDDVLSVNHVQTESIDFDDYIDFESKSYVRSQDYYSAAIWYLLNIDHSPITTWLDLSLMLYRLTCDPQYATYALQLKHTVQNESLAEVEADPRMGYAEYVNNAIKKIIGHHASMLNDKFVQVLCHHYNCGQNNNDSKSIFDYLYLIRNGSQKTINTNNLGIEDYISSLDSIYKLTVNNFSWLVEAINNLDDQLLHEIKDLKPISDRLLLKLKNSSKNLHLLNNPDKNHFLQDKIIIKYNSNAPDGQWALFVPRPDQQEKIIKIFDSVIELLVWSYINRVIDTSTQISSHCPHELVDPIDLINIIKLLSDNIDLNDFDVSDLNVFTSSAVPIKSIIFVGIHNDLKYHALEQINQLIIYNNGEFHTQVYTGYDNFIACIYNWFNLLSGSALAIKPSVQVFGIKPGRPIDLGFNINRLIKEVGEYFNDKPIKNVRTVLKKDNKYYLSHITQKHVESSSFDDMLSLYKYLERPLDEYTSCLFANTFDQDLKLSYLFKQNKENTIQLFYYICRKNVNVFIFDENGALFTYNQVLHDRQSFINHWILFLHNMKKKYPSSVTAEISQLVKLDDVTYEHMALTGDMLPSDNKYYHLDLQISQTDKNVKLSFTCENKTFTSTDHGRDLYCEISNFISKNLVLSRDIPIYISNIDVPKSLLGNAKSAKSNLIDYLKYKRNVENRLNEKISCL